MTTIPPRGTFSDPYTAGDYVPKPNETQRNLRYGQLGVGANVPEPYEDFHEVPGENEYVIHGEGIPPEVENERLAKLKKVSIDYAREESEKGIDPRESQAATVASARDKYATAIGQERFENPTTLISNKKLPPVNKDVDQKQLVEELKDETRSRETVENEKMTKILGGGPAANVQSAMNKLESVVNKEE
ncbi:5458_t:CDS:2 [Diversispora eburnea]|uniref:5458_t:CDS:1 n=1 Tax=Diversispora eburnea TaxID=1213867 RepID=A0A9N8Z9V2_9GLOM|nr:5458_t:CDS:2 [Diversispora eburnea]